MNSEQNNELEEIDYNNPESIEKPKKKRVSKRSYHQRLPKYLINH